MVIIQPQASQTLPNPAVQRHIATSTAVQLQPNSPFCTSNSTWLDSTLITGSCASTDLHNVGYRFWATPVCLSVFRSPDVAAGTMAGMDGSGIQHGLHSAHAAVMWHHAQYRPRRRHTSMPKLSITRDDAIHSTPGAYCRPITGYRPAVLFHMD